MQDATAASAQGDRLRNVATEYGSALVQAAQRSPRPLIVILAPPSAAFSDSGPFAVLRQDVAEQTLRSVSGVHRVLSQSTTTRPGGGAVHSINSGLRTTPVDPPYGGPLAAS